MGRTFQRLLQRWIRMYNALSKKLWKASTSILPRIPQNSGGLARRLEPELKPPLRLSVAESAGLHHHLTRDGVHDSAVLLEAMPQKSPAAQAELPIPSLFSRRDPGSPWDSVVFLRENELPSHRRRTPKSCLQGSSEC